MGLLFALVIIVGIFGEPTTDEPTAPNMVPWEVSTYADPATGIELRGANIKAEASSSPGARFSAVCLRDTSITLGLSWGLDAIVMGGDKLRVHYFVDGVEHRAWWDTASENGSVVPPEDVHATLNRLLTVTTVGFEVFDYAHADSPAEWARFNLSGLPHALTQLQCSATPLMVAISNAKSALTRVETHADAGSGIVLRASNGISHVVTAWHIVESYCANLGDQCIGISVVHEGVRYQATLLTALPSEDIAILGINADLPVISTAAELPPLESRVMTIGLPEGEHDFQYNQGIIVSYEGCEFVNSACLQTNAKVWEGFSGGALINYNGELIGIISGGWPNSFYSTAVSVAALMTDTPSSDEQHTVALTPQTATSNTCKPLCDWDFWESADREGVLAELGDGGANIYATDDQGLTPLHYAANSSRDPSVIALLLERGADVGATSSDGFTPLHAAAMGNPEALVIELLLDHGADIEAMASNDSTPLHHAVVFVNEDPSVLRLLLDRGANVDARTIHGDTPCQFAGWWVTDPAVIRQLCR